MNDVYREEAECARGECVAQREELQDLKEAGLISGLCMKVATLEARLEHLQEELAKERQRQPPLPWGLVPAIGFTFMFVEAIVQWIVHQAWLFG